ncbi:integrase [Methylobacterium brachiatum]|uniref:integrase n=1 Tax=Methylobacterium brachiatum TaxID=269660 RepID=UPI00244B54CE|nr:integrase [Methylobacterium brachiatum]MDH2311463.1 integrase [Methylobacterium brachiatum]
MVDLPRHVRGRPNPSGRMYFSFEKFRGTERAWPVVPLPESSRGDEFWRRCRQCEALAAERTGDGWAWAWVSASGRSYPLPPPRGGDGQASFWAAVDAAEARDKADDGQARKTFDALIEFYKTQPAYEKLAPLTKRDYDRHLVKIGQAWGSAPVASLTAVLAQEAIDLQSHTPAGARYFRAVLSKLLSFGAARGYCTSNVARITEKVEHEVEPHKPWSDKAFEAFFEHARPGLHLPVYSALYTGQRSVDVVTMARPAPGANAIELIARKTGAEVFVPIHSEYREILTRTHIDHPALHLREDGAAWTLAAYRTAWQREITSKTSKGGPAQVSAAKATAMKTLRDGAFVFHGLRKNAVNMLLEAGNTEAEVSAIVEMSEQMVRHYSRDVNKRRLAINGMRKLEECWKETRANLFGPGAA